MTFGAPLDLRVLVDHLSSLYGLTYEWTDARRDLAEQMSAVHQVRALAESGAGFLLGIGSEDPYPIRELTEQLASAIQTEGGTAETRIVPEVAHSFVDEPGDVAVPQGPQARAVDQMASQWFLHYLG